MRIITLVENTCGREGCLAEHGLSVYIETNDHRILIDAGQTDAIINNAAVVGIDLDTVDTVILSHGHYDHSGGILPFSAVNSHADIYMQRSADEPHYNGDRYIGIDKDILSLPNVNLIDGDLRIDDELFLFSGIHGERCRPQGNSKLTKMQDNEKVPDDFAHEQCLVISCDDEDLLISGCAHNGILNILDRYKEIFGRLPDRVISGFHMMKKDGEHTAEEIATIRQTARELAATDTIYYSGHCTGIPAFKIMKEIMGEKLIAMHSGESII